MKRLYNNICISFAALASLSVVSCSEDGEQSVPNYGNMVSITSSEINHVSDSRVWKSNDRVGVYQFDGEDVISTNIQYCNTAFDGQSAIFKAVNNDEGVEYISGRADLMAYYPYHSDVENGVIPLDLSTQLNAEAIDLVVADRKTLTEEVSDLPFGHKLSMLRFVLVEGSDIDAGDLFDIEVSISGIYVSGSYDLIAGEVEYADATSTIGSVVTADGGATIELVVLPQDVGDVELAFQGSRLGRNLQSVTIDGSFTTANVYEYNVTISKSAVSISSPTITPWADSNLSTSGDSIDITGNPFFDVADPEVGYYYYADGTWSSRDDLSDAGLGGINSVVGMIYHIDESNKTAYVLSIEAPFAPCGWADLGFESWDDGEDKAQTGNEGDNTGVNTYESNTGAQNMYAVQQASEALSPAGSVIFNGYPAFQLIHNLNDSSIDYSNSDLKYNYWYMTNTAEAKIALAWIIDSWDSINGWFDEAGRSNGSSFPTYATNRYWGAADNDGDYNAYSNGAVSKYRTMSIYPTGAFAVTGAQQLKSITTNYTLPIMQIQY